MRSLLWMFGFWAFSCAAGAQECATWPRALPPEGLLAPADRLSQWQRRLESLEQQLQQHGSSPYWADVQVLAKACRMAIEFREFYHENDFAKCDRLLELAEARLNWLNNKAADRDTTSQGSNQASGPLPGPEGQRRLQVRGFVSRVDGSAQPIGLVMPDQPPNPSSRCPLFVWLHGRGDKSTDLHFICERLDKAGEVAPSSAITLHPFGRQCVGYKSAGTTDVMEAIDFVCRNYPVDPRKIVLIGFSMGGAGAWHVAARHPDRFAAVSPGAGFAETARYQNLTPDKYPPSYTQTLWSIYDVPQYTRNLFNLPVIAYSGENDKQIQAARVMEEAFAAHGRTLSHLIGPGMGHKYHPDVLKELLDSLTAIADRGQPTAPTQLFLQTRHWRVHRTHWISIEGIQEPYADTQVTATLENETWKIESRNVSTLKLEIPSGNNLVIDSSSFEIHPGQTLLLAPGSKGSWHQLDQLRPGRKRAGQSGPIDDAFFDPFMMVLPSGQSNHPALTRWVECEAAYQISRWKSLMRGQPRVKLDVEVTDEDIRQYHLVLWGDSQSNSLTARVLQQPTVPLTWTDQEIRLGASRWRSESCVPCLIMPSPLAQERYVVLNSGPTFRDAHDRTNSLQNPQLPDWAILDLTGPRSPQAAGPVLAAGFFSDDWK